MLKKTIYALLTLAIAACSGKSVTNPQIVDALPDIYPDYIGVTVPPNIAPLNFCMKGDSALAIDVNITGPRGSLHAQAQQSSGIAIKPWHKLLAENAGDSIMVQVSALYGRGWKQYKPFPIYISRDSIDYGLTYRLIAPGYEVYSHMGIYERNLSTYDQTPVLENTQVDGCMNCHSYNQCNPNRYSMHVRGNHSATLLRIDGEMRVLNTATDSTLALCVYPYWHPAGRYIAYSTNNTRQGFNVSDPKRLEVFDFASDVQVLDTETNELFHPNILKRDSVWETFPAFSPDGRSLYFCAARARAIPDEIDQIRYDLCRIDFDPSTGLFGNKIDTIVHASADSLSVSFPRPSFDGRYLMYTLSNYGNFSIWHPESDLYLLDLATGDSRELTRANSDNADSYHNWSSNSRWFVIGSRRENGWFTMPYICHIDSAGQEAKPFLLPQENPRQYYDRQYRSYNIPEFITCPVALNPLAAESLLLSPHRDQLIP